jgi:transcriptional repressor NrdR
VREPFERDKIRRGLEKACWKRPVGDEQIAIVVDAVEHEVTDRFDVEVDSHTLGELVMEHLRKLDQVAYVRFASVYRQFKDVRDFVDELRPILREQSADAEARAAKELGLSGRADNAKPEGHTGASD